MEFRSIVNSVADKAGVVARSAVKKGGEMAENAKIKLAVRCEAKKLEAMFATLGKLFYEQTRGTDVRVQIKAQIMEINEQKLVIYELKMKLKEASGKAKCAACGASIKIDAAYCPECGCSQGIKIPTKESSKKAQKSEVHTASKPLSAEDFVGVFKSTVEKYF